MKLNYTINKEDVSQSYEYTPGSLAQRLPFCVYSGGYSHANKPYYTEREGVEKRYLLIFTKSGQGYLKYIDNEYWLNPNSIVVFNSHNYQYYATASGTPWEFKWVYFYGNAVSEYDEMINPGKLNVIHIMEPVYVERLIDEIFQCMKSNELLLDAQICRLILNLLTELVYIKLDDASSKKSLQHKTDINDTIDFIHDNYTKKILVDDIVDRLHISKFHFLRLFKAYTGSSLYEYLGNYRVNKAKELLRTTDHDVEEIASLVGFNSSSNFILYFKKTTGTTPKNYRKNSLF